MVLDGHANGLACTVAFSSARLLKQNSCCVSPSKPYGVEKPTVQSLTVLLQEMHSEG